MIMSVNREREFTKRKTLQHFLAMCPKFLTSVIFAWVFKVRFHGLVCSSGICDVFLFEAGVICSHWLWVLSNCWKKQIFPFSFVFWWWIPCSIILVTEIMPANNSIFWCIMDNSKTTEKHNSWNSRFIPMMETWKGSFSSLTFHSLAKQTNGAAQNSQQPSGYLYIWACLF